MATPSDISIRLWPWISPGVPMPKASGALSAAAATHTAARPTSEWKAATSCGIAVIAIERATKAPTPPPMARPSTIRPSAPRLGAAAASVVRMAIAMPAMPR